MCGQPSLPAAVRSPLDLPQSQALEKGMKMEGGKDGLLTSSDDFEGGLPMGHVGHYRISFNSPVKEETESWRD